MLFLVGLMMQRAMPVVTHNFEANKVKRNHHNKKNFENAKKSHPYTNMDNDRLSNLSRNNDIDIVKGMLVVSMIVYHCASMGRSTNPELKIITSSLNYLHFAFLIVSGFLCGWYYLPKFHISKDEIRNRLLKRTCKILSIFIILNIILYATGFVYDFQILCTNLTSFDDFLHNFILSMNGKLVAFEVLYYIALFLLFVSLMLKHVTTIKVIVTILIFCFLSQYSASVLFVCCGLMGLLVGLLAHQGAARKYWLKYTNRLWLSPLLYFVYLLNDSLVRDIRYSFPAIKPFIYFLEAGLFFSVFLLISRYVGATTFNYVMMLGKYTLLSYLTQMLIIRVGYIVLTKFGAIGFTYYFINLFLSTFFLVSLIVMIDKFRNTVPLIDNMYRKFFV